VPVLKQSLRGEKRAYKGCSLAVKTHSSARRTERIDPPRADYAIVDGSSARACPEQRQNSGARFDNSASAYDGRSVTLRGLNFGPVRVGAAGDRLLNEEESKEHTYGIESPLRSFDPEQHSGKPLPGEVDFPSAPSAGEDYRAGEP
jgi:hypothetical protein